MNRPKLRPSGRHIGFAIGNGRRKGWQYPRQGQSPALRANIMTNERNFAPRFDEKGLLTAVCTDAETGEVLMLAHMNAEALEMTLNTDKATFWSRSRQALWTKGETSGNVLHVLEARIDCDQDAVWLKCRADGPACHTGARSCFYRVIGDDALHPDDAAAGL